MTVYETIYQGADNFLTPKYYFSTNYRVGAGEFGMSLDPRTANQLGELNTKINPGIKHIEVSGLSGATMESIPDQHLEEMKRSAKLNKISLSLHLPLVEASGVGEKGNWEESNRLAAEKQLESAVLRSHKLDPKGNISVTTHSTSQLPEMITKIKDEKGERITGMYIIQPDSGRVNVINEEKRYFPAEGKESEEFTGKPREFKPEEELERINKNQWTENLSSINMSSTRGEEMLKSVEKELKIKEEKFSDIRKIDVKKIPDETDRNHIREAQRVITHGQIYLRDAYRGLKQLFDLAYANAEESDKEKLTYFIKEVRPFIKEGIEENPKILAEVVEKGVKVLEGIKTPQLWKPLQDFVVDKTAQTFANVAASAYKEFGDTSPILNIENPPAGGGLSRAEDIKKVIEETREKFIGKLVDEGYSKSEARKASEKIIGATWDVGHINMLRKKGYSEKDIIKEAEKIAPYVKHIHLSDNFGLDHTELPMGMGNVPIKEVMKKLGKKGFEAKKIIEAGNWWQYFADKGGGNPFRPTVEAFDSPIYSMKAGPYWSQTGGFGNYYMGHGPVNMPIHHKIYDAGFMSTSIPMELGGEVPGDKSRFAGTPNQ